MYIHFPFSCIFQQIRLGIPKKKITCGRYYHIGAYSLKIKRPNIMPLSFQVKTWWLVLMPWVLQKHPSFLLDPQPLRGWFSPAVSIRTKRLLNAEDELPSLRPIDFTIRPFIHFDQNSSRHL